MTNWGDYFTDEEKKEIAEREFTAAIRNHLRNSKEVERVLFNLSHKFVQEEVDKAISNMGGEKTMQEIIEPKIIEILNNMSSYHVFRKKDTYLNEPDSVAQTFLDRAVQGNKHLIEERVKEIISTVDLEHVRAVIWDTIRTYFTDKEGR